MKAKQTQPTRRESLARQQIYALRIAEGFFGSQVLFAANELGVFEQLAQRPRSVSELAALIGASPDPLERLLSACVSIGVLELREGQFANSELAQATLVSTGPGYLGNWMRLMSHWMQNWVHLKDAVLSGTPSQNRWLHLGDDPVYTRDFIMGMHDYAQLRGSEIVRYLQFSGGLKLLDLGGGPGTYAILFAKQWPDLKVTIFDLPEVVKIAERNALAEGVASQISVVAGNYYQDEVGEGYDVVFLSDTLHQEDSATCRRILDKAYRGLKPGGGLVVQAMFLNEDRVSPRWPVMHSLILLLAYGGGRAYTVSETIALMEGAGFANCRHVGMSMLNVNSLIMADKGPRS